MRDNIRFFVQAVSGRTAGETLAQALVFGWLFFVGGLAAAYLLGL